MGREVMFSDTERLATGAESAAVLSLLLSRGVNVMFGLAKSDDTDVVCAISLQNSVSNS